MVVPLPPNLVHHPRPDDAATGVRARARVDLDNDFCVLLCPCLCVPEALLDQELCFGQGLAVEVEGLATVGLPPGIQRLEQLALVDVGFDRPHVADVAPVVGLSAPVVVAVQRCQAHAVQLAVVERPMCFSAGPVGRAQLLAESIDFRRRHEAAAVSCYLPPPVLPRS